MLAVEDELVEVAVEEAAEATVVPVEDSRRPWTVDSLVVMLVWRVVTSSSRFLREVFWVSVQVTEAEAILLATVLTDELVAL